MSQLPNHYIFVASQQLSDTGADIPASSIFARLMETRCWYLCPHTPFRHLYKPGDKFLFYLGGRKHRYFAGTANAAGTPRNISPTNAPVLSDMGLFGYDEEIPLTNIDIWQSTKPVIDLIPHLLFIKDKENYGLHFRQGAVRISREDYSTITGQ